MFLFLLLIGTTSMTIIDKDSDTHESSIGEAFKLSQVDDVDGYVGGGNYLFSDHPEGCILERRTQHNKKNYTVFTDRADLMHAMAIDLGLSSAQELLDWTPSADYSSGSESGQSGYRMEMLFIGRTRTIKAHCINEKHLNQGLLTDFRTLTYPVQFPFLRSSWSRYEAFLGKWGTHLLRDTWFGVKVVLLSFKTDKNVGLEAHFCSKMSEKSIPGIDDLPIHKYCANFELKDYKEHDDTAEEVYVYGGTPESKAQLQNNKGVMDSELIIRLSEEALTHEAPVKNNWESIPSLLNTIFMFSEEEGLKHRSIAFLEFYNDFYLTDDKYIVNKLFAFMGMSECINILVFPLLFLVFIVLLVKTFSVKRETRPASRPVVALTEDTSSISSSVPMVGAAVVAHYTGWQFFPARVVSFDKTTMMYTVDWDDPDLACRVQPYSLVAANVTPMDNMVGIGSSVLFKQGTYSYRDSGGPIWNLGEITSIEEKDGVKFFSGMHSKTAVDGLAVANWPTFRPTFERALINDLRLFPIAMDMQMVHASENLK